MNHAELLRLIAQAAAEGWTARDVCMEIVKEKCLTAKARSRSSKQEV